jgi:sulfite exporter TauE/SafE
MLSSITPLGERGRNNRYALTAAAHIVGAIIGGAVIGAIAGGLGSPLHLSTRASAAVLAVLAVTAVVLELHVGGLRLPTIRRQVNEDWLGAYRGWVYGGGFGLQLGMGVATIVTTAAVYLMVGIAVVTGSVVMGAAVGAMFGAVRGGTVLATAHVHDPETLRSFHRRLHESASSFARATVAFEAAIIVLAITAVVRTA